MTASKQREEEVGIYLTYFNEYKVRFCKLLFVNNGNFVLGVLFFIKKSYLMECSSNISNESSMSTDHCSLRLRVLTLVTNTADLINERTTPTLSISHALVAPIALFTTYVFLIIMVIGATRRQKASYFIQIYAIVTCTSMQTTLSIIVFRDLKANPAMKSKVGLILNSVLPMITIMLLIGDLIVILFSSRDNISAPPMPTDSRNSSHSELHSGRSQ